MLSGRPSAVLCCVVALSAMYGRVLASPPAQASTVSTASVDAAIRRGVDYLWSKQRRSGRWVSRAFEAKFRLGQTALVAYTLRRASVVPTDPRLRRGVQPLLDRSNVTTVYARSLTLMLWCALDARQYRPLILEDIRFLEKQQSDEGAWGYGRQSRANPTKDWYDQSNSQFALAALATAAEAGFDVSPRVWRRAEASWLNHQNTDGGWGYVVGADASGSLPDVESDRSMAAAGLASLMVIADQLHLKDAGAFNGRFKAKCGLPPKEPHAIDQALDRAWVWWDKNFDSTSIPVAPAAIATDPHRPFPAFYLHLVSRLGTLSGRRSFGQHDWARAVSRQLVDRQQAEGSWGTVHESCFAILALLETRRPVLISKLRFGEDVDWNRDPRDAANLVRWWNRQTTARYTWDVVGFGDGERELGNAPILLVSAHEWPALSEVQQQELRRYVYSGGTIIASACCSSQIFVDGFKGMVATVFPHLEMDVPPKDHPVWSMHDEARAGKDVLVFRDGCRTPMILLSGSACCAWQQDLSARYERLFRIAGNVLAFATFERTPPARIDGPPSGTTDVTRTVSIARVRHGGDWWSDPYAIKRLNEQLSRRIGLGVREMNSVALSDLAHCDADVLWLTGHTFKPLKDDERRALSDYFGRGGMLISSACCGRQAFDEAFRAFAADFAGGREWQAIPRDDPIMTGMVAPAQVGSLSDLNYRRRLGGGVPAWLDRPLLFGLRSGGRWVMIHSPYDLTCGATGHTCLHCVGYEPADAATIMGNLLLSSGRSGRSH